ncbi:MAG: hypothetical protein EZS28_016746 [Streblomastix strix]|uniref:Uncharacterized protein n=1 Tax=Streblomastix strix TaxID=222440 RepID=A0A5J4VZR5_9EUKA|nr:MAG: hypothetical protein EZS28_016746 [Streblomastix strix]
MFLNEFSPPLLFLQILNIFEVSAALLVMFGLSKMHERLHQGHIDLQDLPETFNAGVDFLLSCQRHQFDSFKKRNDQFQLD